MNTPTKTLLLLSMLLCGVIDAPTGCGAVSNHLAEPASSDTTPINQLTLASRLFKRGISDNLMTRAENVFVDMLMLPITLIRKMGRIGQFLYDRMDASFKSFLFLYNQFGPPGLQANWLGERHRRSLSALSDILASSPIATLTRTIRSVQGMTEEQIASVLSSLTNPGYNFLTTKALPWLRDTLDSVSKSPNLPGSLRNMIDEFDTLYRLVQILGFAGSSGAG